MSDTFGALWVSHTSISDFLKCPRSYYLKNMYKDPKTNHKMQVMSPSLALGQAVHEVLESLSQLPTQDRFKTSLLEHYEKVWSRIGGKRGGFFDADTEYQYKERGAAMLRRVMNNPGPISTLAVKIKMDLPHFWLSQEDKIILCGKIDWLEYFQERDSVHIIDFKTGKNKEESSSLQLPIYLLLVNGCQRRKVEKASYWYLETDDNLEAKSLPDPDEAYTQVLKVAKQIKLARVLNKLSCPTNGCRHCKPFEMIIAGKAEYVGENEYHQDIYVFPPSAPVAAEDESEIL